MWEDHDLVFPNTIGNPIEGPSFLERGYTRLVQQAGLPYIRFHDLRHTAATLLLLKGVHPKKVSEMLGHGSVAITLTIYSLTSCRVLGVMPRRPWTTY
jgi:integrase